MTENQFELTELKKGDLVTMERVGLHLSLLNSWDVDTVFSHSLFLSQIYFSLLGNIVLLNHLSPHVRKYVCYNSCLSSLL